MNEEQRYDALLDKAYKKAMKKRQLEKEKPLTVNDFQQVKATVDMLERPDITKWERVTGGKVVNTYTGKEVVLGKKDNS